MKIEIHNSITGKVYIVSSVEQCKTKQDKSLYRMCSEIGMVQCGIMLAVPYRVVK